MKKIILLCLMTSIGLFGYAQKGKDAEFSGAVGAISPLLIPNIPPPPTLPLPFPNPLPDLNNLVPVLNEYTVAVDSIGVVKLNELVGVKLDLTHPNTEDLRIILRSPFGTELVLVDTLPNGGANMTGTIFTLDADSNIRQAEAPYTGKYLPLQTPPGLNNFLFENSQGNWVLGIQVRPTFVIAGSPGTLNSWSLVFNKEKVDTTTAVKNAAYAFEMYPNPANGILSIQRTTNIQPTDIVSIYSSLGQLMYSAPAGQSSISIDTHTFSEGLYFIELQGAAGNYQQKLMIKH